MLRRLPYACQFGYVCRESSSMMISEESEISISNTRDAPRELWMKLKKNSNDSFSILRISWNFNPHCSKPKFNFFSCNHGLHIRQFWERDFFVNLVNDIFLCNFGNKKSGLKCIYLDIDKKSCKFCWHKTMYWSRYQRQASVEILCKSVELKNEKHIPEIYSIIFYKLHYNELSSHR